MLNIILHKQMTEQLSVEVRCKIHDGEAHSSSSSSSTDFHFICLGLLRQQKTAIPYMGLIGGPLIACLSLNCHHINQPQNMMINYSPSIPHKAVKFHPEHNTIFIVKLIKWSSLFAHTVRADSGLFANNSVGCLEFWIINLINFPSPSLWLGQLYMWQCVCVRPDTFWFWIYLLLFISSCPSLCLG